MLFFTGWAKSAGPPLSPIFGRPNMATHDISLGKVDVSKLESLEDFHQEAQLRLPIALRQIGEAAAEKAWENLQKSLIGADYPLDDLQSHKQKFILEAGLSYQQTAEPSEREKVEDRIFEQLRTLKAAS